MTFRTGQQYSTFDSATPTPHLPVLPPRLVVPSRENWEVTVTIDVLLAGERVQISRAVFAGLLDNSVAGTYKDYERALASGSIEFAALVKLARRGEIPYPLFFARSSLVNRQVSAKTKKLLDGVGKDTFSLGSRAQVDLRDIELILKDLIRKQELLKRYDDSLGKNRIVGMLRKEGPSPEDDALRLMSAIELTHQEIRQCRTKAQALELIIEQLESKQVMVSRSVRRYMPQRLEHVDFSGLTIRDAKVPYIFLAGGDHGDNQEPVGRTIFTLALMAVLVARRTFAPVTWNAESIDPNLGREYDIAGSILVPASALQDFDMTTLDEAVAAADEFKVTPSAVVVRALRLGQISREVAGSHLAEFRREFAKRPVIKGMNPIRPENAVRKYAGRELSRRMIEALDAGAITRKEFLRSVCLNKIEARQIEDLRKAVR